MSYPGRHLHGCVCFCDAARFWDAQDGEVEERKRRAPDGYYKMQRTLLWLADANGNEPIKHACVLGGSRVHTKFNLAPALLALLTIVGVCACARLGCFLITSSLQNYRREGLFYPSYSGILLYSSSVILVYYTNCRSAVITVRQSGD